MRLGKLEEYIGLIGSCLYNAGNDVAYTLKVYFKLTERLETMEERADERVYVLEKHSNRCQ